MVFGTLLISDVFILRKRWGELFLVELGEEIS
jgi:hypothetical protein